MENHLRLARARGSLQGPNNAVQDLALRILRAMEQREAAEARVEQIRLVLLTNTPDRERMYALYPEFFPEDWVQQEAIKAATAEDGSINIDLLDDTAVKWDVPSSEEEDAEISRWIAQQERGTATAADLGDGWI